MSPAAKQASARLNYGDGGSDKEWCWSLFKELIADVGGLVFCIDGLESVRVVYKGCGRQKGENNINKQHCLAEVPRHI